MKVEIKTVMTRKEIDEMKQSGWTLVESLIDVENWNFRYLFERKKL